MKQYPVQNLPLLELVGSSKRVLEIGCGQGAQSRVMAEFGNCEITGVEIDADAAEHARPFCRRLVVGDVEKMSLEEITGGDRYDVISFADVLEHLRDPASTITKLRAALDDDGYVVASIPNVAHSAVIYEMAHGRFEYRPWGLLDDTHIRFFTADTLHEAFRQAGLVVATMLRTRIGPADTEFKIRPASAEDEQFLQYIRRHNQEADTYQFIVKAVPASNERLLASLYQESGRDDEAKLKADLSDAELRIRELTTMLDARKAEVRRLESQLSWTTNRPVYKFLSAISNLIKGRRASS